MYHQFIINPAAGKKMDVEGIKAEINAIMQEKQEPYRIDVTTAPGDARELARRCAEERSETVRIYSVGGDGTLNEVVNGAAGHKNAQVACCPRGSGNDFVKLFGAHAPRFRDLRNLVEGESMEMDLIDCNGQLGINICSAGLDARVCVKVGRYKLLPLVTGKLAYILALIVSVLQGISRKYRILVDGEQFEGSFALLAACNGRWYGGGFNPSADAVPNDGLLDFVLVQKVSLFTFVRLVGAYASGRAAEYPDIIYLRRGKSMSVTCERSDPANIDGEVVNDETYTFTVSEKKLAVAVPQGATW